jgi:hypothetical protein
VSLVCGRNEEGVPVILHRLEYCTDQHGMVHVRWSDSSEVETPLVIIALCSSINHVRVVKANKRGGQFPTCLECMVRLDDMGSYGHQWMALENAR